MKLVSIDFETANRYRTSPCAVGIVVADEDGIIDEFYSLINPLMDFDYHNILVHGIQQKDVEDAPTFDEIWPLLDKHLSGNLVVAHNASFDMGVLRSTLDRYELEYPAFDYVCSVGLSKQIWPGLVNYKLNTLAEEKQIGFNHHHALEDARVVIRLLLKAKIEKEITSFKDLVYASNIKCGQLYKEGYFPPKTLNKDKRRTNRKNYRTSL